jgi:hypothetical protein
MLMNWINKLFCKMNKKGHKYSVSSYTCVRCGTPDTSYEEVAVSVIDEVYIRIDMDALVRIKDKIVLVNDATMRESYQRHVNRIIRDELMYLSDGASDIQELIQELYASELKAEDVPTVERLEEAIDEEIARQSPDDEYEH